MNRILARSATLGLGLITAGLAFGASTGAASAAPSRTPSTVVTLAPAQFPTGAIHATGWHAASIDLTGPVRPTHDPCKPNSSLWGCGAPADPDNVTESTDCTMTQGQDPTTGGVVFQEFCITNSTYWEGQDSGF